jgi:hypothetical protein
MKTDPRSILYSPKYTLRRSTSGVYVKYIAFRFDIFKWGVWIAHRPNDHNSGNVLGLHSVDFVIKSLISWSSSVSALQSSATSYQQTAFAIFGIGLNDLAVRLFSAAMKVIGNVDRQKTGRWLNNRGDNSHQALRRRERAVLRLRRTRTLQKLVSV